MRSSLQPATLVLALLLAFGNLALTSSAQADESPAENPQANFNPGANGDTSVATNAASSPYEVECAPFAHAQGTIIQVKIVRASDEAQVTMGAPSFNVPTTTQSYPVIQKISDTHGRTVNYQANNFVLTLNQITSTANVQFLFEGEVRMLQNLVCRN